MESHSADADFHHSAPSDSITLLGELSGEVVAAARSLIGCRLVRIKRDRDEFAYRIIETEAYHESEPGSHSYKGVTERTATMFGRAGLLYVYIIYGMYYCANVVAGKEGEGAAVLIRALEPLADSNCGQALSGGKPPNSLSGPGKLCRELGINRTYNGLDLLDSANGEITLKSRKEGDRPQIESSTRIGISKATDLEWRFVEKGNPRVSRAPRSRRS